MFKKDDKVICVNDFDATNWKQATIIPIKNRIYQIADVTRGSIRLVGDPEFYWNIERFKLVHEQRKEKLEEIKKASI